MFFRYTIIVRLDGQNPSDYDKMRQHILTLNVVVPSLNAMLPQASQIRVGTWGDNVKRESATSGEALDGVGARSGSLSKTFWLSVITTIWMLAVNTLGFVDTFTHSTESLGRSWPFTQQGLFPSSWDKQKIIEYTHRVLVSGVTILLLTLTVIAWIKYRKWIEVKILSGIAIVFVFIEAALGAMAVLMVSPPAVVAFHMGVALIAFCGVSVLTALIASIDKRNLRVTGEPLRPRAVSRGFTRWSWIALAYVLGAIYFGSFGAASGASGAFQGWPLPTESYAQVHWMYSVDVAHRSIAAGLLLFFVALTWNAKARQRRNDLFAIGLVLIGLTCAQAASGAMLIYTDLGVRAFLLHVTTVTFIFAVASYLAMRVLPEPKQRRLAV